MKTEEELYSRIEENIKNIVYPTRARALYSPIEYTLQPGGKRIRPMLCLRACEAVSSDPFKALNQALAVEMFHNFTLIHDDVMDGSDTRRNHPTVFSKWGSTQAILSGDALLTMAIQKVIEGVDSSLISQILDIFNKTALEVYEGQQLDIDFEQRNDVTTDEYIEMILLKTSVLLGCSCAMGAIMGGADSKTAHNLYRYGEKLGLAFQLRDDWLDTFGDPLTFGKPIGGDIRNRKKTWLFITSQNEAPYIMSEALNLSDEKIVPEVTKIYESLNLSERCDRIIGRYCNDAIECIKNADISDELKAWFINLAQNLCQRKK